MKRARLLLGILLLTGTGLVSGEAGANQYGVTTESVDNYGCGGCNQNCNGNDLCNSNANNAGFLSQMEASSIGFYSSINWTDSGVYYSDFVDPDLGWTHGNDTNNFDGQYSTVAYYTGHGYGGSCDSTSSCTSHTQCTDPSSGSPIAGDTWAAGSCVSIPQLGAGHGFCCYPSDRAIVVNGAESYFSNAVWYGPDYGYIGWGESSNSGSWDGAAENGGINLIVLDMSWPVAANYAYQQWKPLFAGARMIAATQPIAGDTAMVPDRGAAFGAFAFASPSSSVFTAWNDAMFDLESGDGSGGASCPSGSNEGFNGCGCNYIMAIGDTSSLAEAASEESWEQLPVNTLDSTGKGYYYYQFSCNYDSNTYSRNL
jgi:hypothetical protein